jgi:hypothetical protein
MTIPPFYTGVVTLALLCALPLPCRAIAVSGPGDLQPADFWVYVEGTNGAFARVEQRDDQPVSIEIDNPVVGGVAMQGHIRLHAEAPDTGPATRTNVVLSSAASGTVDTDLDLASLLTFDLAVLSPTSSSANVGIVGRGLGGRAGFVSATGGTSISGSYGYVTLYETNATGGFGPIVRTWEVPGTFTTTPIDDVVTLATNQLYRIVIRSLSNVDIRTPATLEQYSYMFVDPQLGLVEAAPDAELLVSANLPEALPEPSSLLLAGAAWLALGSLARRRRGSIAAVS